jgi:hypothetical protein
MASATARTWRKRDRRHANMGRRRKAALSKRSTPSYEELFAGLGAPAAAAKADTKN